MTKKNNKSCSIFTSSCLQKSFQKQFLSKENTEASQKNNQCYPPVNSHGWLEHPNIFPGRYHQKFGGFSPMSMFSLLGLAPCYQPKKIPKSFSENPSKNLSLDMYVFFAFQPPPKKKKMGGSRFMTPQQNWLIAPHEINLRGSGLGGAWASWASCKGWSRRVPSHLEMRSSFRAATTSSLGSNGLRSHDRPGRGLRTQIPPNWRKPTKSPKKSWGIFGGGNHHPEIIGMTRGGFRGGCVCVFWPFFLECFFCLVRQVYLFEGFTHHLQANGFRHRHLAIQKICQTSN